MSRLDAAPGEDAADRFHPADLLGPRTFLVLVTCLAAAGVVTLADAAGEHEGLSRLDPMTAADVLRLRTPALTHVAQAFTFLGSELVVGGLAIVVFLLLLTRGQFARATTFTIAMGGSAFLTVAVKLLVARPRPSEVDRLGAPDTTYSFPSGHTLNSAVFLALVVWLLWPSLRHIGQVALVAGGAVMALGVAASRVYLGYHWLTDVLASGLVAISWLSIVWILGDTIARCVTSLTTRCTVRL
ncbi:MAG: phosphatase PAP2 family protein [Marmoricola sp.]